MAFRGSSNSGSLGRITAWSYSRLKTWKQCPYKLKLTAIDRLREPESEPQVEGQRTHKAAEDYLNGERQDVDDALKLFAEDIAAMREAGAQPELRLAFRRDLTVTTWFSGDAWLRVIFDVFIQNGAAAVYVGDLKTGKPRIEDRDQLELFALAAFIFMPDVQEVDTELLYTKLGKPVPQRFERSDMARLKTKWFAEAEPMLNDTEFLPNPTQLCKWCSFRKENGGPCKF